MVVQVDPIKPKLKPPGTKHLKLNCDILFSTSDSNSIQFNVRRYIKAEFKRKPMSGFFAMLFMLQARPRPTHNSRRARPAAIETGP
jgi:hypothetical protein